MRKISYAIVTLVALWLLENTAKCVIIKVFHLFPCAKIWRQVSKLSKLLKAGNIVSKHWDVLDNLSPNLKVRGSVLNSVSPNASNTCLTMMIEWHVSSCCHGDALRGAVSKSAVSSILVSPSPSSVVAGVRLLIDSRANLPRNTCARFYGLRTFPAINTFLESLYN